MKAFFRELFQYNYYQNQQLGDLLDSYAEQWSLKILQLYGHTLNAHHIWNHRILNQQSVWGVWDIRTVPNCINVDTCISSHFQRLGFS